jgi:hypothetical protein
MATVDYLDNDNTDGTNFGRTDEKIGFYGLATPIVKQTLTEAVAIGASNASVSRGIREIQVALKSLGLLTTV